MEQLPILEYKGYRAILTLNSKGNRLWGKICAPENPSTPMDGWSFSGDDIKEAELFFRYQVNKIISHKEFKEKCDEWKSKEYDVLRSIIIGWIYDEDLEAHTKKMSNFTLLIFLFLITIIPFSPLSS